MLNDLFEAWLEVDQKFPIGYTVYTVVDNRKESKMSEVRLNGPLYKVTMTEYERGYGQRPMGEKYFDNEEEAREFCKNYFSGDSECYFRADYQKISD